MLSSSHRVAVVLPLVSLVSLLAACGGGGGEQPAATPASITAVEPPGGTLSAVVGSPVAVRVRVADAQGNALRGVPVSWSTFAGGVSATSSTTDVGGVATTTWTLGPAAGTQSLSATAGSAPSLTFTATATADRAATVTIARDTTIALVPGARVRFTATVRDRYGNPASAIVRWSTSDVNVASIDSVGNFQAFNAGAVSVIAVADTARAQSTVTIARPAPFTVTRIPTDTLKASANLTLTGDGFAPGAMSASIAGFPASILDVTSTRLLIAVPSASGLPCAPPSVARIVVRRTSGGVVDSVVGEAPLDPATPRILAIGQRAVLARPDELRCTRLEHGGEFVVSIYDASTTAPGGVAAQLRGRSMGGTIAVRAPVAVRAAAAAPRVQPDPVALAHAVHLARERTRLRALGARAVAPPPRRPLGARAVAVPAVGDVVTLNAMYFDCAAPTPVRARVAAVGAHSLVVEDTAAAGAGSRDALYRDLADEFDRVMLPIVTTYFGDPLALDAKFGGDGRVRILFTPYVTDSVPNTFGFMTGCNFVPKTQLASSNEAAVFYARLPLGVETATEWRRQLRATLVHETKHLAAYAERFARAGAGQPVLEETWLEEATARVAEELYARTFSGATWKGNAAFAPTVGCELTSCDGRPIAMLKHFSALGDYYARVDSLTPLGPVSRFDGSFYGSGWLLVRWAADNFASDEAAFFRALTTETAVTGIQNLVRRTVRAPYDMLPDWSLALAVDDRPGFTPRDATLTIPSWNTRDVFRGLSAANPIGFPRPFPLLERTASFGDFVVDVPLLRSYTSAFVELSGPVGTKQLLSLQAPTDVGLAIVRVR